MPDILNIQCSQSDGSCERSSYNGESRMRLGITRLFPPDRKTLSPADPGVLNDASAANVSFLQQQQHHQSLALPLPLHTTSFRDVSKSRLPPVISIRPLYPHNSLPQTPRPVSDNRCHSCADSKYVAEGMEQPSGSKDGSFLV